MWWDYNRISWYKTASENTDFHAELTNLITKHLAKSDKIVELGCGLGYITKTLFENGYNIHGYDIDNNAIEFAKANFGDYFSIQDCQNFIPISDVCLTIFFGHFTDFTYFERVLESTKKLIIVSNLHNQFKTKRCSNLNLMLEEKNIDYIQQSGVLPFHQPFSSYQEALSFINSYYPNDKNKVIKSLQITNEGYLLENNKSFTITIVNGRRE